MFFPKAMSEIELIVPAKDLLRVTRILSGRGVFHQSEVGATAGAHDHQEEDGWHNKATSLAGLERRAQGLMQTLGVDWEPFAEAEFNDLADPSVCLKVLEGIEQEVRAEADRLSDASRRLEQLRTHRQQLETVADIDLNVSVLRESRYLVSMLGAMPATNVSRMQTSLARVPHLFLKLRDDSHRPVVWIAGTQANRDVLERSARSAYFESLTLPMEYEGTPREVLVGIDTEIARLGGEMESYRKGMRDLSRKHTAGLSRLAWSIHASRTMIDAILKFGKLRHTYVIVGWVPSAALPQLSHRIRQASRETITETLPVARAGDKKHVPVALNSSRILKPFQTLVTTYARPQYGEMDPTWLIALTFPILFGAMFGDVGHGLLLAGFGALLISRRVKALHSLAGLGGLVAVCGLVAAAFGFLYGSIFGFEHVLHAAWLQPGEDPLTILGVAIGAGVVLLSMGFVVGIFNGLISRDWAHLLFGHGGIAAALLYWSLLGFAGASTGLLPLPPGAFGLVAVVAGLAIMFSSVLIRLLEGERPLIEGGLATYAIQAPMELFETVVSFLSNSLSYVRVGAFAIAHVVLSSVVFLMAELVSPGHGVGYWTVVIVGNIGIVLYEGLIVGIQAMRLSYYEFFSKFFTGGGMRFQPLTLQSRQET